MVRSCYTGTWRLPGWGDVTGYFYFADAGTPFLPGWSWLGSRNWHDGDGTAWPVFGEKESTSQIWRNGSFAGERPIARSLGEEGCLEKETGVVLTAIGWRGALPVRCFGPVEEDMPTGAIIAFGGATIPAGWLACDGAAVSRIFYSELFTAIGTTWGPGDGVTTFNTPDLRGRAVIGSGQGIGLTNRVLGSAGGEESHILLRAELASHNHGLGTGPNAAAPAPGLPEVSGTVPPILAATALEGQDQPHNNMQPWGAPQWIVKT